MENPKINGILLVKGGLEDTHYASYNKYVRSLMDIRKTQVAQQEEEAKLAEIRAQKLKYEEDDSDLLAMGI